MGIKKIYIVAQLRVPCSERNEDYHLLLLSKNQHTESKFQARDMMLQVLHAHSVTVLPKLL